MKISGKRTIIGGLILSVMASFWSLDQLLHDLPADRWLTTEMYESISVFVGGLTGVALRLGISKNGNGK